MVKAWLGCAVLGAVLYCAVLCCMLYGVEWCGWQEKNSASETLLGNVVKKQTGEIGSGTQHGSNNGKGEGRRAQRWSWKQ